MGLTHGRVKVPWSFVRACLQVWLCKKSGSLRHCCQGCGVHRGVRDQANSNILNSGVCENM